MKAMTDRRRLLQGIIVQALSDTSIPMRVLSKWKKADGSYGITTNKADELSDDAISFIQSDIFVDCCKQADLNPYMLRKAVKKCSRGEMLALCTIIQNDDKLEEKELKKMFNRLGYSYDY